MDRETVAKLMFDAMQKRSIELDILEAEESLDWAATDKDAAIGREVFRAAADAVLAQTALA